MTLAQLPCVLAVADVVVAPGFPSFGRALARHAAAAQADPLREDDGAPVDVVLAPAESLPGPDSDERRGRGPVRVDRSGEVALLTGGAACP